MWRGCDREQRRTCRSYTSKSLPCRCASRIRYGALSSIVSLLSIVSRGVTIRPAGLRPRLTTMRCCGMWMGSCSRCRRSSTRTGCGRGKIWPSRSRQVHGHLTTLTDTRCLLSFDTPRLHQPAVGATCQAAVWAQGGGLGGARGRQARAGNVKGISMGRETLRRVNIGVNDRRGANLRRGCCLGGGLPLGLSQPRPLARAWLIQPSEVSRRRMGTQNHQ